MPTQNTDLDKTWNINTSNDTWTLTQNATISTDGEEGVLVGDNFTGNDIHIDGDVVTSSALYNVRILGNDNTIVLGKQAEIGGALVSAANVGIGIDGTGTIIDNAGVISGHLSGITADIGTEIVNTGKIEGVNAIFSGRAGLNVDNSGKLLGQEFGIKLNEDGDSALIVNQAGGLIKSGETGVSFGDASSGVLRNFGTISGPLAISAGSGETVIVNRGTIHGDIALGDGEDRFDTRGGSVSGKVDGGGGNDTYLVGGQSVAIAEQSDSGNDIVKSTVSYTLAKNIENLTLIGHKDIDGTGNAGSNSLYGNDGDNILSGRNGSDDLTGGKGDDILVGGKGADIFVFDHKDGHDTIADFHDGKDVIFTDFISSEEDFDGMVAHHLTVKGDDLLLHGKHSSLLIQNMDVDHLDFSDFFTGL